MQKGDPADGSALTTRSDTVLDTTRVTLEKFDVLTAHAATGLRDARPGGSNPITEAVCQESSTWDSLSHSKRGRELMMGNSLSVLDCSHVTSGWKSAADSQTRPFSTASGSKMLDDTLLEGPDHEHASAVEQSAREVAQALRLGKQKRSPRFHNMSLMRPKDSVLQRQSRDHGVWRVDRRIEQASFLCSRVAEENQQSS